MKDTTVISFSKETAKNLFEPAGSENQYYLTQDVKYWLVKNNIKVFIGYDKNSFEIEFESREDADFFVTTWNRPTKQLTHPQE